MFIHRTDGEPMAFAGLWEVWRGPDKETADDESTWVHSCTIITGEPNEVVAPIHDRMPVDAPAVGLGRPGSTATSTTSTLLGKLLVPAPASLLAAHPVEHPGEQRAATRLPPGRAVRSRRRSGDPAVTDHGRTGRPPPTGPPPAVAGAAGNRGSTGCCCAGRRGSTPSGPTGSCPWIGAAVLFVVYLTIALARASRLDAGDDLGPPHAGGVAAGPGTGAGARRSAPTGTCSPTASRSLFVPMAAADPGAADDAHAACRPGGRPRGRRACPLWQLARRVAHLRVGAAAALCLAYALHPAVSDLDLADFHPAVDGDGAAARPRPTTPSDALGRFAIAASSRSASSSELGHRDRRPWACCSLLERRAPGRPPGARRRAGVDLRRRCCSCSVRSARRLVAPPARSTPTARPSSTSSSRWSATRSGRSATSSSRRTCRLVVWVLAPLCVPAGPRPAEAASRRFRSPRSTSSPTCRSAAPTGPARTVPFVAFCFVAATFALARLGRRQRRAGRRRPEAPRAPRRWPRRAPGSSAPDCRRTRNLATPGPGRGGAAPGAGPAPSGRRRSASPEELSPPVAERRTVRSRRSSRR